MKKLSFILLMFLLNSAVCHCQFAGTEASGFKLSVFSKENTVSLEEMSAKGKVTVLSFFDTKCEPCKKEFPKLKNVIESIKDKNYNIFLVCLDEKPHEILPAYIKEHSLDIPILLDPLGYRAGENYGVIKYSVAQVPQIFVIGKDKKIKKHYKGFHEDIDTLLTADISKAINEVIVKEKNNSIQIAYSNSANGHLESCDCPQNPFGGLVRRITAMKRIKNENPKTIIVDSGDFSPPRPDKLKYDYAFKLMDMIDYDFIAPGDQELLLGSDYLSEKMKNKPYILGNVKTCNDKLCYPLTEKSYLIKEIGNVKIGILGILNPDIFTLFPKDKIKNLDILSIFEYLKNTVAEMKKDVDIIVLVSHSGNETDRIIAETVTGIDVIIGGHSQTFHKIPVKINNTYIVQTGENGHRVGILELDIIDGTLKSVKNTFVLLDKDVKDDPNGRKLVNEYHIKLKDKSKTLVK